MKDKISSSQEKCKNCGGNLYYDPKSHDLLCDNCGTHTQIIADGKIQYHDLNEKQTNSKEYKDYVEQNKAFKCPNCGANVILNKFEISQVCPYCATPLVINEQNYGLKPDAIIPFQFDENDAAEKFVAVVKKRFWAPRKFKKKLPENEITGIYIPSFGFDADTFSKYDGRLFNEVTVRDSDGHTHTERHYFRIGGTLQKSYQNVMVECSSKITQRELHGFLPYNFDEKMPYTNQFILGYSVEQYDKEVKDSIETYHSELRNLIERDILRKYVYDGVDYLNVKTDRSNEKYQYHILPVYRFEYDYKGKKYVNYMNGQNGKVDGNTPKSKLKIGIAIALGILVFVALALLGAFKS